MLIAGLVLFFIGIILVISYPINKRKNSRCTAQTEGELVDIRRRYSSNGPRKSMHIYSYQVDGVEYRLSTLDHSLDAHKVGDACTIWYNPEKPNDAQAFQGSDKYLRTLLLVGIALILLSIVVACVAFYQQFIAPSL